MLSLLADISAQHATKARPQAGILDHEGHQPGRVAANAEEFQAMVLNKALKGGMSGQTDTMAVDVFQDLAQGNEGLYISTRAHDLDDYVQGRRGMD